MPLQPSTQRQRARGQQNVRDVATERGADHLQIGLPDRGESERPAVGQRRAESVAWKRSTKRRHRWRHRIPLVEELHPARLPAHRAEQASGGFRDQVETLELELEKLADHLGYEVA